MAESPLTLSLTLDDHSSEPVYQQIAAQLRDAIESGIQESGSRLPAIRALATDLGVHRDTIALAYDQLAQWALVEARVGAGTFVKGTVKPGVPSEVAAGRPTEDLDRRSEAAVDVPAHGGVAEIDFELAPQVERLIALENTRPRYATGLDVVPLHRLVPDPRFYPVDDFKACMDLAIKEEGPGLFSYASPEGDPRLRRAMANRFRRYDVAHAAEELVLCHGASQGISLAMRLFAQPGDQVAVETPTYANVLSAMAGYGLTPMPVSMDDEGVNPEALDRVLSKPEVKVFYTIPSFHNPLGTTTSLARRKEILEIATRHGVPVVEDAFEIDLRFQGEDVPPLAALDRSGIVVLLFSFSKSLFPGVRVGSLSARGRALEGLVALKHATDLSDALPLQAGLARFVETGAYDHHLDRIKNVLRARYAAMSQALTLEMPAGTKWTEPDGGYQMWVDLPFEVDTRDLLADAARAGVVFSPGALFMPDGRPSRGMRLTVACADEDEIRRGVAALGEVVRTRHSQEAGAGRAAGLNL